YQTIEEVFPVRRQIHKEKFPIVAGSDDEIASEFPHAAIDRSDAHACVWDGLAVTQHAANQRSAFFDYEFAAAGAGHSFVEVVPGKSCGFDLEIHGIKRLSGCQKKF